MARYRIVCTEQEPADHAPKFAHIVAVGTGTDAGSATKRWTVQEVWDAIDREDTFYTKGERSGKVAEVEKWTCQTCSPPRKTLRSLPDAVEDNNLDDLRTCQWKSK